MEKCPVSYNSIHLIPDCLCIVFNPGIPISSANLHQQRQYSREMVKVYRHCLPPTVFVGHLTIGAIPVFFNFVFRFSVFCHKPAKSRFFLNEKLSFSELVGCSVIFAAILIAQIPVGKKAGLNAPLLYSTSNSTGEIHLMFWVPCSHA